MWVRWEYNGDGRHWLVRRGPGPGFNPFVGINTAARSVLYILNINGSDINLYSPNSSLQPLQWNFVASRYNGVNMEIYIAGNRVAQSNIPGTVTSYISEIIMGSGWTVRFKGLIDEVRVYNRALSDSEIKALYEATK
jgi:hypothetical protein